MKFSSRFLLRSFFSLAIVLCFSCEKEYVKQYLLYSSTVTPVDATTVSVYTELLDYPSTIITAHGYCWSTESTPTISADTLMRAGSGKGDKFEYHLSGLTPGKEYYIRAYVVDGEKKVYYGNELRFLNNLFPLYQRTRLNAITQDYYEIFSTINASDSIFLNQGHAWSLDPNPTIDDNFTSNELERIGENTFAFTSRLSALSSDATYYIRPFTSNRYGTTYGNQIRIKIPSQIVTGRWTEMFLPEAGLFQFCILQDGNYLYFITGGDGSDPFNIQLNNDCYRLNMETNEINSIAEFPGPPRAYGNGFVLNGKIYFGTCADPDTYDSDVVMCHDFWEYDPTIDSWTELSPTEEWYAASVAFTTTFDGMGIAGSVFNQNLYISYYMPDSWSVAAEIPLPEYARVPRVGFAMENLIYFVIEGERVDVIEFDFITGNWEEIPFPEGKADEFSVLTPISLFSVNNTLHAIANNGAVFSLDRSSREWSQRSSIPYYVRPEYIFSGTLNGRPLIGAYFVDTYAGFIKEDYSLWYTYEEQ
jgi:hypothetical protein